MAGGRRRSSTTAAASFAAVAVAVLGACGPSGSRYLSDRTEEVYLKVPRDWRDVEAPDSADSLLSMTAEAEVVAKRVVSPEAVTDVTELSLEEPVATMAVYEISGTLNQRMSTQLARIAGSGLTFDPALPSDEYQGLTEVLEYDPDPSLGERPGSRLVYRLRPSPQDDWAATFDMTTYFDPVAQRLYVLEIGCSTTCFEAAQDDIARVASSWEVGR